MASGVQVADQVIDEYNKIKSKHLYRYIIFFIKDEKVIDIEKIGEKKETYQDFLDHLESVGPLECRYGLYDMEYTHQCQGTSDAVPRQKLFLMIWCPDSAKIKKKMLYSSSFDALKQALVGVGKFVQATDMSEAAWETVKEKVTGLDRI